MKIKVQYQLIWYVVYSYIEKKTDGFYFDRRIVNTVCERYYIHSVDTWPLPREDGLMIKLIFFELSCLTSISNKLRLWNMSPVSLYVDRLCLSIRLLFITMCKQSSVSCQLLSKHFHWLLTPLPQKKSVILLKYVQWYFYNHIEHFLWLTNKGNIIKTHFCIKYTFQ